MGWTSDPANATGLISNVRCLDRTRRPRLRDPRLVPPSIAQGIGLPDSKGRPLVEHLADHLRDRKLLIVLDNFEHLLPAAPVELSGEPGHGRDLCGGAVTAGRIASRGGAGRG